MQPSTMRNRPVSALRAFLSGEAFGGLLLMAAAAAALLVANSPLADGYARVLGAKVGPLSVLHWINDGLMAVFFLLVGLEVKREWVVGQLKTWDDRRLPFIAASSGMVVPAAFYLIVCGAYPDLVRGWAIPAATDIAFAVGVLALLGSRAPASLKLFLTTVAIIDDMGAVAVIALGYTSDLHAGALLAAALILAAMVALNLMGVRRLLPYLVLAVACWVAVLSSGVHATIAGVLSALTIPVDRGRDGSGSEHSPLHRLEHAIGPAVAMAVLPIFGFANAGVSIADAGLASLMAPLPLAIGGGLFLGKQIGVFASIWGAVTLGLARKPNHASWLQLYGLALLCGIGFTMSLFIGDLAFLDPALTTQVKLGVLAGSVLSALAGYCCLRFAPPEVPRGAPLVP